MRMIDADALLEVLGILRDTNLPKAEYEKPLYDVAHGAYVAYLSCIEAIQNAPTIEAEPVKHGHWVWDEDGIDWNIGAYVCSRCRCGNTTVLFARNTVSV